MWSGVGLGGLVASVVGHVVVGHVVKVHCHGVPKTKKGRINQVRERAMESRIEGVEGVVESVESVEIGDAELRELKVEGCKANCWSG